MNFPSLDSWRFALIAIGLSLSATTPAATIDDVFPKSSGACWGRVYDEAHLSKNAAQSVRAIYVSTVDRGKNLERSAEDAAVVEDSSMPRTVVPQIYVESRSGALIAGDVQCRNTAQGVGCFTSESTVRGDGSTAFRFERIGERLQLTAQAPAWPLRSFSELISRADERSTSPTPIGAEDRDFRLDRLPAARCAEVERRYVGAFTDVKQPSILSRVKRAASSREADGRKLCLRSVDASGAGTVTKLSLRLFLDTGKYDWPVEVDEFTFRVTQTLGESRAVSSLSCTARTYAWRCEWRTTDDDREQKANRLANRVPQREETGLLLRGPTGAVLRGFSCLAGRCDHNDANDIQLVWSPPKACEVAP
jgi:hypothetical protein